MNTKILTAAFLTTLAVMSTSSAETKMVENDGVKLHVEVDGNDAAPALLLWNGAACTTHMWDFAVPRLAEHFRVIRFDVRGTGLSDPSPTDYTMEQHASDANAILDSLGIEKTYVWSMAWGSRAAIIHTSLNPDRVTLLALYDASVDAADVDAQAKGREIAFAKQVEAGIPLKDRPENWNHHENPDEVRKSIGAIRTFKDQEGQLSKITIPTLVCIGQYDPNLPSSEKIASKLANAELVVMINVGHGSVLQRPDLCVDNFLAFMKKNGALPE